MTALHEYSGLNVNTVLQGTAIVRININTLFSFSESKGLLRFSKYQLVYGRRYPLTDRLDLAQGTGKCHSRIQLQIIHVIHNLQLTIAGEGQHLC